MVEEGERMAGRCESDDFIMKTRRCREAFPRIEVRSISRDILPLCFS